ncbi:MAG: dTMP kinase [Candidatus Thorarchaeota archaeon]|jgi:dTMP kinase
MLFVLEGVDGAGKTAICDRLVDVMIDESYDVIRLREPTDETSWGQEIRARSPRGELTPEEELELFIRDREWHVQNRILPALDSGKIILMDRYFFATGAYQSTSTGMHWKDILKRNREEISAPEPDIVFILDVPVETGLKRVTERKGSLNEQFEQYDRLVRVRTAYLEMVEADIGNLMLIDARRSIELVAAEVHYYITEYIQERKIGLS